MFFTNFYSGSYEENFMKKFNLLILLSFISISSQQIDLPMEVPGVRYNPSISKPEEILGHKIGLRHTRTDQVVDYFEALASQSNRVIVTDHALTHEGRRLIHAIVTHPDNHKKLDLEFEIIRNGK